MRNRTHTDADRRADVQADKRTGKQNEHSARCVFVCVWKYVHNAEVMQYARRCPCDRLTRIRSAFGCVVKMEKKTRTSAKNSYIHKPHISLRICRRIAIKSERERERETQPPPAFHPGAATFTKVYVPNVISCIPCACLVGLSPPISNVHQLTSVQPSVGRSSLASLRHSPKVSPFPARWTLVGHCPPAVTYPALQLCRNFARVSYLLRPAGRQSAHGDIRPHSVACMYIECRDVFCVFDIRPC